MNFDVILGLVLLFFVYRAIRAVMKTFSIAAANARKEPPASAPPPPPAPPAAPVYRSPRDMTARPSASGSVPRAAFRLKTAMTKPPRAPTKQSGSPFIIDRPRRFPFLGILAVATLIVLIAAAHAWLSQPPQNKPPGRNAERILHLHDGGSVRFAVPRLQGSAG